MSKISSSELAQLKVIEDVVNSYLKSNHKTPVTYRGIHVALSKVLPNTLLPSKKIDIIWNDSAKTPFIMSITPDIRELYDKSEELSKILNNPKSNNAEYVRSWSEIHHWYLEIDNRILTKNHRLCVKDGAQFVAILCHEVGHVMTENPIRLLTNYKQRSIDFSLMEKLMISKSKAMRAILLPMFTHTLQFKVVVSNIHNDRACEMAADRYVPDEYKMALVQYMDEQLLKNPTTRNVLMDETEFDTAQNNGINLSRHAVHLLKDRRNELNKQIEAQYSSQQAGTFHKKLMKFIGRNLTGYDPETDDYTTLTINTLMENAYLRDYNKYSKEATAMLESMRVGTRELDVLEIQVQDIKTPEDKMYYIHKIYDYMEAVSAEKSKKMKNTKVKAIEDVEKAIDMNDNRMDRLNDIRRRVMQMDVSSTPDHYGVYVKYPKGYEG
jgi:hypothetical protein